MSTQEKYPNIKVEIVQYCASNKNMNNLAQ